MTSATSTWRPRRATRPHEDPRARLAVPATAPLAKVICSGVSWSIRAVTLLSTPHDTRAMTSNPPVSTDPRFPHQEQTRRAHHRGRADQPPAQVLAKHRRRENKGGDELEVQQAATPCGGIRSSPPTSRTGPIAPRTRRRPAGGRPPARNAAALGRCRRTAGSTAIAAPTYNSPARTRVGMSPARTEAAGADAPKSMAAIKQRTTPRVGIDSDEVIGPSMPRQSAGSATVLMAQAVSLRPRSPSPLLRAQRASAEARCGESAGIEPDQQAHAARKCADEVHRRQ